jgi:hypothetical protein
MIGNGQGKPRFPLTWRKGLPERTTGGRSFRLANAFSHNRPVGGKLCRRGTYSYKKRSAATGIPKLPYAMALSASVPLVFADQSKKKKEFVSLAEI